MRLSPVVFILAAAVSGAAAVASCTAGSSGGLHAFTGTGGSGGAGAGVGGSSGPGVGFGAGPTTGSGGTDSVVVPTCTSNCGDFPAAPIMDTTGTPPPANAASLFGPVGTVSGNLCVVEPQLSAGALPGALFPANWTRPRFRVSPAAGENLFEIRIKAASEANELVAYTTNTIWTLPATVWQGIGVKGNAIDQPITVTIRGLNTASPATITGSTGTFTIAPVTAGGSMVYWATQQSTPSQTASKLVGFYVGDETTIDALTLGSGPISVQQSGLLGSDGNELFGQNSDSYGAAVGKSECIGCHRSTPDGLSVGYVDEYPWFGVFANISPDAGAIGAVPSFLGEGMQRLTQQPWMGMMAMTPAHWSPGDRITLFTYEDRNYSNNGTTLTVGYNSNDPDTSGYSGKDKLAWFSMDSSPTIPWTMNQAATMNTAIAAAQGSAWGFITLTGETAGVVSPDWSHDGSTIVYTSATQTQDGRIANDSETDIHTVPYNNKMGGTVTPLPGASTTGISEYYPSFSADDKLIAFNRAGNATGWIYYRPDGEVNIIPAAGGSPTRLAANDPPACTGETSPGIINSWARWSPTVVNDTTNGNTYYWMIFSSARKYPNAHTVPPDQYSPPDTRASQLYMTGVVKDKQGNLHTFPAVYVWTQSTADTGGIQWSNLTPAWNQFAIPVPPPPT
jgi:hypothetical protein